MKLLKRSNWFSSEGCDVNIFFVRMRRILLFSDVIDILCLFSSILCEKKLKFVNVYLRIRNIIKFKKRLALQPLVITYLLDPMNKIYVNKLHRVSQENERGVHVGTTTFPEGVGRGGLFALLVLGILKTSLRERIKPRDIEAEKILVKHNTFGYNFRYANYRSNGYSFWSSLWHSLSYLPRYKG